MTDEKKSMNANAELIAPDWINAALIQKALHNGGQKDFLVKSVSVSAATAAGDNYASTIYRVKAALSNGSERSFLVKVPASGETIAELSKEAGIFGREAFMLVEVLPQIEASLEEAAPGRFPPLAARCPLHGSEPVEFLVLEDLAPAGFKMADRKRGLDFPHSLLAVRALARYHAATHALLRRQPELAGKITNPWAKSNETADAFVRLGVQAAADACRAWPGFEEYVSLLEKFKPVAADIPGKINDLEPRVLDVIVHGDFWVNNMMFRYEDEGSEPKDYRMVDFQLSRITSPTLDLHQFFSISVNEDVSANKEDLLIHEYYIALKETLSLLELQAPSLEALLADLNERGSFALVCTLTGVPVVRAEGGADLEASLAGDASSTTSLFEDPAVKKWMQRLLPVYKRKGWLPS